MQKESQEIIITLVAGTITFLLLGAVMISFLFLYRRRQRKHLQEKEQLRLSYERELLKTQLEIQEQTFKNISQEIHDNIGQMLSLAKLNLSTMDPGLPATLEQKIGDTKQLVGRAIHDLRNLSHGLNTDYVADLGLVKAIGRELEIIQRSGGMETELITEGLVYSIDKQSELIVFRIVQESLNNIVKHAKATTVSITLVKTATGLTLYVQDNGQGINFDKLRQFSNGLINMRKRMEDVNIEFSIENNNGTLITLHRSIEKF